MYLRWTAWVMALWCAAPQAVYGQMHVPPLQPKAVARDILSNHRLYHLEATPGNPPPSTLERALHWAGQALQKILKPIFKNAHMPAQVLTWAGYVVIIAAMSAMVLLVVRVWLRLARRAAALPSSTPLLPELATADLYAQACTCAERGDYGAALARLFQAALRTLEQAGIVDGRPAATVGECRNAVRFGNPRALGPFEVIARGFTTTLYAERPIAADDWNEARAAYIALGNRVAD